MKKKGPLSTFSSQLISMNSQARTAWKFIKFNQEFPCQVIQRSHRTALHHRQQQQQHQHEAANDSMVEHLKNVGLLLAVQPEPTFDKAVCGFWWVPKYLLIIFDFEFSCLLVCGFVIYERLSEAVRCFWGVLCSTTSIWANFHPSRLLRCDRYYSQLLTV